MQGSQQQQTQNAPKKQVQSSPYTYQSQERTYSEASSTASQCQNCGAELPENAIFCPECGFSKGLKCPKCGRTNAPSADICQYCKTWLLTGKCKFCYSDVDEGDAFCAECAKPKNGIPCPKCGQLSIFDFCKNCGTAVTKEAIEEIQAAKKENAYHTPQSIPPAPTVKTTSPVSAPASQIKAAEADDSSSQRIILKPQHFAAKFPAQETQPEVKQEEEKELVITIEEAKKLAEQNSQKKFSTPQAARRWHMARRHPDALGWLCNFAGCVHMYNEGGGPDDCHDPSKGGADFFGTMDDVFMNEWGWYQPKKK